MSQNSIRVLKTFLNSFGDRRHVFCCNNAVNKHDFTNESIDKTPKYTGVDQILPCMVLILSVIMKNTKNDLRNEEISPRRQF